MPVPADYPERTYAGVLGKIIGVYLGRPFEGWSHDRIVRELGEIDSYVHERLGKPLVVTDDDISGTFTFLRALEDYDSGREIRPAQIGLTWLNYVIENKTILWWGGMGHSTEHTAYLRLKRGIPAPQSGSAALNGQVVSEQVGAQIFIDGWGMAAPGDPALAADLARRAASVSHDGEAIHAAQAVAAMEAQAFVESDLHRLLDVALGVIPESCLVARLIGDLRRWRREEPDWRRARDRIDAEYGYHRYGGNCHVIPNHGLIILGLLWGEGSFSQSLKIVNTCGWDTDCNSGNLGCLLGIRGGLAALDGPPDWRGPVADRIYLPTADGGRSITDAVAQAGRIVNLGRALAGEPPWEPKTGARFHFSFPGSVQGFAAVSPPGHPARIENADGASLGFDRCLEIRLPGGAAGTLHQVMTSTLIPPAAREMPGYALVACPTLYPGQRVEAGLGAGPGNREPVSCRLVVQVYDACDELELRRGPECTLVPGEVSRLDWVMPDTGGYPVAGVGLELGAGASPAVVSLDRLTWSGAPSVVLGPTPSGSMWKRAWVPGVDHFGSSAGEPFVVIQDEGTGLLIQGSGDWQDYEVSAVLTPHMVETAGLCARVQGMRRYYALQVSRDGAIRLIKALDGTRVLAEAPLDWGFGQSLALSLHVESDRIRGSVDGKELFRFQDRERPLTGGGVALQVTEGRLACGPVTVTPAG